MKNTQLIYKETESKSETYIQNSYTGPQPQYYTVYTDFPS